MMFCSHYHFNWELAVLVTADRDADAHKQYSDLINILSLLKRQKQVKNKHSATVGRSKRTARKSTI